MSWDICPWCGSEFTIRTDIRCIVHDDLEVCGNCGMCRRTAQLAYSKKKAGTHG